MKTKNLNVIILIGSGNGEFEISCKTGENVFNALTKLGYQPTKIFFNPDTFADEMIQMHPDVVFNAMHGKYGEDGFVPAILDKLKIKYTHSGRNASKIGLNKIVANKLFKENGIPVSKNIIISHNEIITNMASVLNKLHKADIHTPELVFKPVNGGSSVGVVFADISKLNLSWQQQLDGSCSEYMIEEYCKGREFNVIIIDNILTTVAEAVFEGEIWDYNKKYLPDSNSTHIYNSDISREINDKLIMYATKMHKIIGCRDMSRSEFRIDFSNSEPKIIALEINTHPGMSDRSFVPEALSKNNINFDMVIEQMVRNATFDNF